MVRAYSTFYNQKNVVGKVLSTRSDNNKEF